MNDIYNDSSCGVKVYSTSCLVPGSLFFTSISADTMPEKIWSQLIYALYNSTSFGHVDL
jgi:hypothetical protein